MAGERILVVDDDPLNRELARAILDSEGYDTRTAGNGAEALASVASGPPGLVVTDLAMPGMDGFELARKIRESHGVPVLAFTACSTEADWHRAREAGCAAILLKPVEAAALLEAVAALLGVIPAKAGIQWCDS